jgi:RNA polymerase sigma factor (sigma-70 family)
LAPLVDRYSGLVYSVVSRVLAQQQDCEDACQATFLSLVRSAKSIKSTKALSSWLYTAAFRISIRIRRANRLNVSATPMEDLQMIASKRTALSSESSSDLDPEILFQELDRLPDEIRQTLIEHFMLGYTAPEIATRMDLSVSAVEGRIRRGRSKLHQALEKRGVAMLAILAAFAIPKSAVLASPNSVHDLCLEAIEAPSTLLEAASVHPFDSSSPMSARVYSLLEGEPVMFRMSKVAMISVAGAMGLVGSLAMGLSMWPMLGVGANNPVLSSSFAESDPFAMSDPPAESEVRAESTSSSGEPLNRTDALDAKDQSGALAWRKQSENINRAIAATRLSLDRTTIPVTDEITMNDIFEQIRIATGLSVMVNESQVSLDVDAAAMAGLGLKGQMTLQDMLELLSDRGQFNYVLHPTRIELVDVDSAGVTRIYDVRELLRTQTSVERKNLSKLVSLSVYREQDSANGGSFHVHVLGNALIAICDDRTHRRLETLLGELITAAIDLSDESAFPEPPNNNAPMGMGGGGGMM